MAIEIPMVNGMDPPLSVRPGSTQEKTVKTKTNVMSNSMPNPCPASTLGPSWDVPIVPSSGTVYFSMAAPAIAPPH